MSPDIGKCPWGTGRGAKPSPVEYQRIIWPIINAHLLNSSSQHYHYPLDFGFQIKIVVSFAFPTSHILPRKMFFGGKDVKHSKFMGNIHWVDQYLIEHILNMTPMVFSKLKRNLGEVKGNVKTPQLWHMKKATATKHHLPVLVLICTEVWPKYWHTYSQSNRYFTSPWQVYGEIQITQSEFPVSIYCPSTFSQ